MSQPPIENMVWTNSHAYTQNRINLHNTLYLSKIITLFRVYPRSIPDQFTTSITCKVMSQSFFGESKMRGDAQYASPHMNENTLP